ncbi:MAG: ABC transporter permease [Anaerolineales bacterium]|nr:ABC transporter permease [Anaerolineales bacterium]MCB0031222.1 ABC transporter permease [Anaerolineales bacterium]
MTGRWDTIREKYLPTIVVAISVIALWELLVRLFNIQQFLLPKPSAIVSSLFSEWAVIQPRILFTLRSAVGGFLLGTSAGILMAFVTARFVRLSEAMMPFAIAANSVPIIALSPIMFNWFGPLEPFSWMMIVAIMVFFPVLINVVRGLTEVNPNALELMRSYAASDFKILFSLRVPNALPYLFSALRVASVLSMIGAIVADFFGAERNTLGKYVTQEAAVLRFENTWAAILVASLLGIMLYTIIVLLENWVTPWAEERRE